MKLSRGTTAVCGAAVAAVLAASPTASAASTIDLPQPAGNAVQVSVGQDVFRPALWPITNANISTAGNNADHKGNNTTGKAFLFGTGAGNAVQLGVGGNIVAPQVGLHNTLVTHTTGNTATDDGNGSTSVGRGTLIDGNGNIWQVAILQGNIIAPQIGLSNDADHTSQGNLVDGVGNGSVSQNGFTFLAGNGNVYQIEILSNNVIAPQLAVGGNNDLVVDTSSNVVHDAGNDSSTKAGAGILAVTSTHVGNGNVTQISILSNNVWAPQIALPGANHSAITTTANGSGGNGNGSDTTADNGSPAPPKHPILHALGLDKKVNQLGNGNTVQHAANSGAISNTQVAVKPKVKVATPIKTTLKKVVNAFKPKPKPAP